MRRIKVEENTLNGLRNYTLIISAGLGQLQDIQAGLVLKKFWNRGAFCHLLFNVVVEVMLRGVKDFVGNINIMMFADDIMLYREEVDEIQRQ